MTERPTLCLAGGLGDIIMKLYRSTGYHSLEHASETTNILLVTHNPFVAELFRWHPNREHFVIFDLFHKFREYVDKGYKRGERIDQIFKFLGIPRSLEIGARKLVMPNYYAPDPVESDGHVIFQPYAGAWGRCLTPEVIKRLLECFSNIDRRVFVITRSYVRTRGERVLHNSERFDFDLPDNVTWRDDLSVPSTMQLLRRSHAFVGAHSSLLQGAWMEGKATVVMYRKGQGDWVNPGKGYAWGARLDNCRHYDFGNIDFDEVSNLISAES
ncbi:MAG: hypothetical protein KDM63_00150 [Verrucomicrobiae bacterium]|nr:hypothetical protein [Verrucomicrobiae bacterium]MCB1085426.1 hypothetical protein [Verrucomicrobiae bacterium]